MKKTYIPPKTEIEAAVTQQLMVKSGVTGLMDDHLDIGYGGIDTEGNLDPSSNQWGWDADDSWDKL